MGYPFFSLIFKKGR